VIAPNADSSPLWSLSDQSPQPVVPAEVQETRGPAMAETNGAHAIETIETAPQAHMSPQSDVAADQVPPPAEEAGKDPRKGWWQRRFKI
jgi:hypothetical protein